MQDETCKLLKEVISNEGNMKQISLATMLILKLRLVS